MQIYAINTMSLMCPGPGQNQQNKKKRKRKEKRPNSARTKLMPWQRQPHWLLDLWEQKQISRARARERGTQNTWAAIFFILWHATRGVLGRKRDKNYWQNYWTRFERAANLPKLPKCPSKRATEPRPPSAATPDEKLTPLCGTKQSYNKGGVAGHKCRAMQHIDESLWIYNWILNKLFAQWMSCNAPCKAHKAPDYNII